MTTGEGSRPTDATTDEVLLEIVRTRSPHRADAWSMLVRRLSPRMYAVARSFRLDPATCDDLVQTAWLRLIEHADRLVDRGSVRPWLCAVVRNDARKLVTRTRTVPVADGWERAVDEDARPVDAELVADEEASAIRSAFVRLSDECRQLLRLTLADPPLSYDEIAAAVGRPRGSLGPTRRRCLERLAALMPPGFGR